MNEIKSFTFYSEYFKLIDNLSTREEKEKLLYEIFEYVFKDIEPNLKGMSEAIFINLKRPIDISKSQSKRRLKKETKDENINPRKTGEKPEENQRKTGEKPQQNTSMMSMSNVNVKNKRDKDRGMGEEEEKKEKKKSIDDLINDYTINDELRIELKNHLATRKAKKATLTNRAIELSLKKLDELVKSVPVNDQEGMKLKIVRQSIERGWTGFFPIPESKKSNDDGWDYIRQESQRYKNQDMPF